MDSALNHCIAYVDGSCSAYDKNNPGQNRAAWGLCIMQGSDTIHTDAGEVDGPPELVNMRNIAGELKAAMEAVRWARDHKTPIVLCYDYKGIEEWAAGRWKRKNPWTQAYHNFMQQNARWIRAFLWVRGHSGSPGNETADRLAGAVLRPSLDGGKPQPNP